MRVIISKRATDVCVNYPRSKGLFLSLPQRQTMVLLYDNTMSELRSRTTPTSQFSSLHFIASMAIGAMSIETRTLRVIFWTSAQTWASCAFWRRLADCRVFNTASRRWLFDWLCWGADHHAQRWVATEFSPPVLPCGCHGVPAMRKPKALLN